MEVQERHQTVPADLGSRSELLVQKHASYIKRVAEASKQSLQLPPCVIYHNFMAVLTLCSLRTAWSLTSLNTSGSAEFIGVCQPYIYWGIKICWTVMP